MKEIINESFLVKIKKISLDVLIFYYKANKIKKKS